MKRLVLRRDLYVCLRSVQSLHFARFLDRTSGDIAYSRAPFRRTQGMFLATGTAKAAPTSRRRSTVLPNAVEVYDGKDFFTEYKAMLQLIESAVRPVAPLNENFRVYYEDDGTVLTLQTLRGKFIMRPDMKKEHLVLQSYTSGFHSYYFDAEQELWLSELDDHDLRGLLTRDLLRHCAGCAHFP